MLHISFTRESGADVSKKLNEVLSALEIEISIATKSCDFGAGVLQILIGVICASDDLLEAGFFRIRRTRLQKARRIVRLWDGREIVFERCLHLDISLKHRLVLLQSHSELRIYVIESVIDALSRIKKYDDFDQLALIATLKLLSEN